MSGAHDTRGLERREFLLSASVFGTSFLAGFAPSQATESHNSREKVDAGAIPLVDVNVNLFHWPYRRCPWDDPETLVSHLRQSGVQQAWAGSFEAILHRDISAVNQRLVDACSRSGGFFLPCPTIQPNLPDWAEDFRRCVEDWGCRVIRLLPNYHGYSLDAPETLALLSRAAQTGVVVQIVVEMEDERTQHPLARVAPVDLRPLEGILRRITNLKIMLLNAHRRYSPAQLRQWMDIGNIWVDLTMLEGIGGIERLLTYIPAERVCFGSFTPLFCFQAARLKLVESDLSEEVLHAVAGKNSTVLLREL